MDILTPSIIAPRPSDRTGGNPKSSRKSQRDLAQLSCSLTFPWARWVPTTLDGVKWGPYEWPYRWVIAVIYLYRWNYKPTCRPTLYTTIWDLGVAILIYFDLGCTLNEYVLIARMSEGGLEDGFREYVHQRVLYFLPDSCLGLASGY